VGFDRIHLDDAMIDIFNSLFRVLFDSPFAVFHTLNPWVAMTVLSLLTALVMLLAYRLASNQQRIRAVKDRIIAHLLEMRLYSGSLPVTLRAQASILRYNLVYLGHSARPMLVMIVPLALAIIHFDQWFGYQPLNPGETAIVKLRLKEGYQASQANLSFEPCTGLAVETPPLRIDKEGEVDWRLRAVQPGGWNLMLVIDRQAVAKRIVVGESSLARISTTRVAQDWLDQLVNPGEAPILDAPAVRSIEVRYPARRMKIFGWHLHWLVVYLVLSVFFGLLFKSFLKVEI
jgi:uncharacterized membrane protein (DUF106 family)